MDGGTKSFNTIAAKDGLTMDMDAADSVTAYFEKWRMKLWDIRFSNVLKNRAINETHSFIDYVDAELLVRCVLYQFVL